MPFFCERHREVQAVRKCLMCGVLMCEECMRYGMQFGLVMCEDCVARLLIISWS